MTCIDAVAVSDPHTSTDGIQSLLKKVRQSIEGDDNSPGAGMLNGHSPSLGSYSRKSATFVASSLLWKLPVCRC